MGARDIGQEPHRLSWNRRQWSADKGDHCILCHGCTTGCRESNYCRLAGNKWLRSYRRTDSSRQPADCDLNLVTGWQAQIGKSRELYLTRTARYQRNLRPVTIVGI